MPKRFDSTRSIAPEEALTRPAVRKRLGVRSRHKLASPVRLRGVLGRYSVGGGVAVDGVFLGDAELVCWSIEDGPVRKSPLTLLVALPLAPMRPSRSEPNRQLASPRQRRFPGRSGEVIELDAILGDDAAAFCMSPVRFIRDERLEAAAFEQVVETDDLGPLRRWWGEKDFDGWADWPGERSPNERRTEVLVCGDGDPPDTPALRRLRTVLDDAERWRDRIDRVLARDLLAIVNDGIAQSNEWNAAQGHDLHRDPLDAAELASLLYVNSVICCDKTAVTFELVERPHVDSIDPEHCVRAEFATARRGSAFFE